MERFTCGFELLELKSEGERAGWFRGYGSTFGNVDQQGDRILPGAFDECIEHYKSTGTMPRMLYDHKQGEDIGDWLHMEVDKKGLIMEGQLWVNTGIQNAERAHRILKSKAEKGLSIGFKPTTTPTYEKSVRQFPKVMVRECSVTGSPVNRSAVITNVKSMLNERGEISIREAEELLRDAGEFSATDAKAFLAGVVKSMRAQWEAEQRMAKAREDIVKVINESLRLPNS
jgi:HK97 family phage prohead protease